MADFVNTIDLLGDEEVTKALVEKTITEFNDDFFTKIARYGLYGCAALTSVNFPNVVSIGDSAFYGCTRLISADFPLVTSLGSMAFQSCSSLESVNLPLANSTSATAGGFFSHCKKLKSINLPSFTKIDGFSECSSLEIVDAASASVVNGGGFYNCKALKFLILRRSSGVCSLSGSNTFYNTPFASGGTGGTLLVPRALVTEYPNETNWSAVFSGNANNRVLALEDYTVDGTITGEIDWDKLGGTT